MTSDGLRARVAAYYTEKIRQYGSTPRGADWRDAESQELRFARLLELIDRPAESLIELGCGYGALYGYLRRTGRNLAYSGYDISPDMIAAARRAFPDESSARFETGSLPRQRADYCVASGIFNVRFDVSDAEWRGYVHETLDVMAAAADRGFAFNCLTSHSDKDRQETRLYYADPGDTLSHCIARYGRRVSLLHGSPSYEFTILVWHGAKQ